MGFNSADVKFSCKECTLLPLSVFNNCQSGSLEALSGNKRVCFFRNGEALIREGEPFRGVYCILSGSVKTVRKTNQDAYSILWFARNGELVGLNSFINKINYTYSTIAVDDTEACFIPVAEFERFLEQESLFKIELMRLLSRRIGLIEERLTSIAQKKTRKRVAELLLSMFPQPLQAHVKTNGKIQDEVRLYDVEDMANYIGTTGNYLAKILHNFSSSEIIGIRNNRMRIRNLDRLLKISNGEE